MSDDEQNETRELIEETVNDDPNQEEAVIEAIINQKQMRT